MKTNGGGSIVNIEEELQGLPIFTRLDASVSPMTQ
jgi:hypothetical protein